MPSSNVPKHPHSLADELVSSDLPRPKHKKRKSLHDDEEAAASKGYVDAAASRKILKIGQQLAEEDDQRRIKDSRTDAAFQLRLSPTADLPEDEADPKWEEEEAWGDDTDTDEVEIDPEDLDTFNRFLPTGEGEPSLNLAELRRSEAESKSAGNGGTDLADLILQRIAEHEASQDENSRVLVQGGGAPEDAVEIPAKVADVFEKVGQILSRYKSGKLPKPFKVLPTLPHWEELLGITAPDQWTPNACYEATKIFVSSRPAVVQPFLQMVLLDRIRDDIHEKKKLNVHLYKALKKATYRPAGFFKGIVFPLIESGTCTLREAHIISSIVTHSRIPPLHASAAMLRLTDIAAEQASTNGTENSGACNMFITAFLEKGYALPYKVVDNLVFHFLRFKTQDTNSTQDIETMSVIPGSGISGKLPVLWHKCFLAFAQRYRNDITEDQRESLLDLLLEKGHKDIGPEVRRELLAGRGRGVVDPENLPGSGGDDTMVMDS